MRKVLFKYIESLIFLLVFAGMLILKLDSENSYLIEFSFGKFFYLFLVYFLLRIFIALEQNKILKDILRTRLNAFVILTLLVENLIIILNMKQYTYEEFFLLGMEKFKSGGLFVSLFGKLYGMIPKTVMLSILGISIAFLFLYVFGKVIGFINREVSKRKSGEYALNREKRKEEKQRLKRAKKEEKIIQKRERKLDGIDSENSNQNNEEDFMVDIKKEFHTMLQGKSRAEARNLSMEEERRRRVQDDIRERHEKNRENKEDKTEIIFLKEESLIDGKLFPDKKEESFSLKNYEQKNLFTYPNEHVELAKTLGISIEKLSKAIELIHKIGIKGSGILERELNLSSDDAERVYIKVKKMREYK